jgi:hypothetical protein
MREEELIPAVHTHLGPLPLRLRDNILTRYEYTPMPPMTYKALKGELWCHRYYLQKLCTPEHQSHKIVEHIRFRNVCCFSSCCGTYGCCALICCCCLTIYFYF